jgi:hypothetical protein
MRGKHTLTGHRLVQRFSRRFIAGPDGATLIRNSNVDALGNFV